MHILYIAFRQFGFILEATHENRPTYDKRHRLQSNSYNIYAQVDILPGNSTSDMEKITYFPSCVFLHQSLGNHAPLLNYPLASIDISDCHFRVYEFINKAWGE